MTKRILITGASSGIGLAIAEKYIAKNYEVIGIARNFSKSRCKEIQTVELDLSDSKKLVSHLKDSAVLNQEFDALILNAGVGRFGGLEQFSHQQMEEVINTNLTSNLILLKHYLPAFKQQGCKDIVLLGSESALQGAKQGAVYCATKFAIRGLAQSLRADCSTNDIRVILINPGPVNSDFFDELNFEPQIGDEFSLAAETVAQTITQTLDLPRNAVCEEVNVQPMKRAFRSKACNSKP